ncbi:MAG: methyltransferase domain-containing protein, partial [Erysipelotrichaceae bacterium]|nr:methyltransferase domain-containing protein [Erysipelotrichaceae bacterium]
WTQAGDFTRLDLKEGFFDLIISECALYLSGQQEHVLTQLPSFLKPEGVVLISDLFPYERNQLAGLFSKTGLQLLFVRDITELWKEYILECLWAGQWNGCVQKEKKELHYYLLGAKNKEKRQ